MQITVDDDTFHKWALDRGYVRLTDIRDFAQHNHTIGSVAPIGIGPGWAAVGAAKEVNAYRCAGALKGDSFTDQVAALEQPTLKEITDALRLVLSQKGTPAAQRLLADFGVTGVSAIPEERRSEFLIAADKALEP
jgi:hypothetical protein